MKRVAVLGANGQVGTEVCLYLTTFPGVEPLPVCRTRLASAFLRRCGVECRLGDVRNPSDAERVLADSDLVVDLSFPRGAYAEARRATAEIIENSVRYSPRAAAFLYMSSLMAFGMPPGRQVVRPYTLAHTQYGALKRHGERNSRSSGTRWGKPVFIFRLGQVHGELQEVSRTIQRELQALDGAPVYLPEGGAVPSNTVFCFTIAEAIVSIVNRATAPGSYILVSSPQWTWREVFEFYASRCHVPLTIRSTDLDDDASTTWGGWIRHLAGRAGVLAAAHRETIAAHVLAWRPRWEMRLTASYFRRKARSEINQMRAADGWRPFVLVGEAPGTPVRSITDSRRMIPSALLAVQAKLPR